MHAPWLKTFRIRCACVLLCAAASAGPAQAQMLHGRWVEDTVPRLVSFDFRGGDTVWQLIPIAAIDANGRGTYEYAHDRLILHYGEGLSDSIVITLRGDTMLWVNDYGKKQTWARVASARHAHSSLHRPQLRGRGTANG